MLCFAATLGLTIPGQIERLSLIAFDEYQRAYPREISDAPIRIVDINDESLKQVVASAGSVAVQCHKRCR